MAFGIGIFLFIGNIWAKESTWQPRAIDVIDTPTADLVDHYGYNVNFRFGKAGDLQAKTAFGVFPRFNIGFGLDSENTIGVGKVEFNRPTINGKFRIFDGKQMLPALALGYDGQGYVYNDQIDKYEQREMGLYLVGTKEIFAPNLMFNLGGNIYDFHHGDSATAFTSLTYTYAQTLGFLLEYHYLTDYNKRRLNFGLRYYVTPVFTVDFCGRDIPKGVGTSSRETERIVRLGYTGSF